MSELANLASDCGLILDRVLTIIEQAAQAEDYAEGQKKYLNSAAIQIKITLHIFGMIGFKANLRDSEVFSAVALVNDKARELDLAVKRLMIFPEKSTTEVLLTKLFQGGPLLEKFGELYQSLYRAQIILVIFLVAEKVTNTNVFYIDVKVVNQIKEHFTQCEGVNYEPRTIWYLRKRGTLSKDNTSWQICGDSLKAIRTEALSLNPIIGWDSSFYLPLPLYSHRNVYSYGTLPNGYIRVIELFPGYFDNGITVKLHLHPFDPHKAPVYEAISYAWGSKTPPSWVRVSGVIHSELPVTKNLDSALRHLRYSDRSRFIWVDAICINQLNDVEKSPQVAIMGEIFRFAARVVVWLGPEENNSDRAMALMEYMGSQVDDNTGVFGPSEGAHDISMSDVAVALPWGADDRLCLWNLLCRPWFKRLWVRQEIMLAKEGAVVLCGSFLVSWQLFRRGCVCVKSKIWEPPELNSQSTAPIKLLSSLVGCRRDNVSLSSIRTLFGNLDCQDPKDRVYGVLALLDLPLGIQPDYTKSVAWVYEDLVRRCITCTSTLDILSECRLSDTSNAPSWLPNWSWNSQWQNIVEDRSPNNSMSFASGHFHTPPTTPISGELKVWGVLIGRIQRLGKSCVEWCLSDGDIIATIRDAFFFPSSLLSTDYVAGGTFLEACTSTLCLGVFRDGLSYHQIDMPEISSGTHLIRKILDKPHKPLIPDSSLHTLLAYARGALEGRCVYETEEGFIGVAPREAHNGDQICVILGCNVPMLLRHVSEDKYRLVGACYTSGIGRGEALLGPLPERIRFEPAWDGASGRYKHTFINNETRTRSLADPRIKDWPIDHERYAKRLEQGYSGLTVNPEVFRARGVDIRSFTLL
ncbi:heterokaryon incompatibility protein-domain-containing protein [Nemania abortiva]|nr:heterokaryon incompatibility protein-domain-containing protein [Nemania abortiva]